MLPSQQQALLMRQIKKSKLTQFISPSDEESIFMKRAVTWSSFCAHGIKIKNPTH